MNRIRINGKWLLCVLVVFLVGCNRENGASIDGFVKQANGQETLLSDETSFDETKMSADLEKSEENQSQEEPTTIFVYICGAISIPGVYEVLDGSRICHVINAAGGFLETADEMYLNQAELLSDGQKIYVPTKEEIENGDFTFSRMEATSEPELGENPQININTATLEQLCTLPGVGEGKARSIIEYREQNGAFSTIEDIMNVAGIKEGLFQKMKDKIKV